MYSAELVTTSNKEMDFQIKKVLSFLRYTYAGSCYLPSMSTQMIFAYFANILQLKIVITRDYMSKIPAETCMSQRIMDVDGYYTVL